MSGLRIKLYREKNGYSQEDLARILDVTRRTVSRWEQNSSKPNGDELKRLATLLGVTEDEILSDEDDLISPSKDAGQNILGKISDSVDNLVTGQEIINERLANNRDEYIDKQSELINSLQDQNKQLLSKLEEQSRLIESYKKAVDTSRIEIRHKRIRTAVLIFTCLIVLALIFGTWLYVRNHGLLSNEYIEGSCVTSEPSYFDTDN